MKAYLEPKAMEQGAIASYSIATCFDSNNYISKQIATSYIYG